MDTYKYTAKDCDIKWTIKIHNYLAGLFARKDLLKEFCEMNGIDYKPIPNKKYKTPSQYLFSHDEIKYLSGIRDKIILVFYEDYKDKQIQLLQAAQNAKKNIKVQDDILESDQRELIRHKDSLKSAKDPQAKITLQNIVETTKTKIKNGRIQLENLLQEQKQYEIQQKANTENWAKQIDIRENVFNIRKDRFDKNASRRISKYLNYTKVHSKPVEYSDSVKHIIKGEIHDEKKSK